MTLSAWNIAIDRFIGEDIPEEVQKLQRVIAIQGLRGVDYRMPVDLGRARGGTIVSVDQRDYDSTRAPDKSGARVRSEGLAAIAGAPAYSRIFIQNNVEYIEELESGTGSKQAPNGMFAVTVAEIEASL